MSTQDQGQSDSNLVEIAVETKDVYEDHKDMPKTGRRKKEHSNSRDQEEWKSLRNILTGE